MTINPDITFTPAPIANHVYGRRATATFHFLNDLPTVAVVGQPYSQTISASSPNGIASIAFTDTARRGTFRLA